MTESDVAAIRPYLPLGGVVFHTDSQSPIADISADLCRIASFLQQAAPYAKLERIHDWWEHDGLHFPREAADYRGLFQLVGTPRALIESMTGDHRVFIAISPNDRKWYLRFFADWDDDDEHILGEYSMSLDRQLVEPFACEVTPKLTCRTNREDVLAYFQRISAS